MFKKFGFTKKKVQKTSAKQPEQRKHFRKSVRHSTFFATRDHLYEGFVRNISLGGLFLESVDTLAPGDIVTLAVPCDTNDQGIKLKPPYNDEDLKMRCEVMWRDPQGFGLRFLKDDE